MTAVRSVMGLAPSRLSRTGVPVEKGCVESEVSGYGRRSEEWFLARVRKLTGYWERLPWSLAEEADQPFDILRSRSEEELFANKL